MCGLGFWLRMLFGWKVMFDLWRVVLMLWCVVWLLKILRVLVFVLMSFYGLCCRRWMWFYVSNWFMKFFCWMVLIFIIIGCWLGWVILLKVGIVIMRLRVILWWSIFLLFVIIVIFCFIIMKYVLFMVVILCFLFCFGVCWFGWRIIRFIILVGWFGSKSIVRCMCFIW